MNLVIEYLQRTGTIREFLKAPMSLLVEDATQSDRVIVSLEENLNCPNSFFIHHWILSQKGEIEFQPKKETFEILKRDVFESSYVILKNYKPIKYIENAIKIDQNSYNSPIDIQDYKRIYTFFLNSKNHKSHKADCLWDSFARLYFDGLLVPHKMHLPKKERTFVIEQEKKYIRMKNRKAWRGWDFWLNEFVSDDVVAAELIFQACYNKF